VGKDLFEFVISPKSVTVKVPSGAMTYTVIWVEAFRGKGGNASAANGGGSENTNILLFVQD
jgi:hypothetical protein